jgi:DNA-binding transcriptional ArsR family regulator
MADNPRAPWPVELDPERDVVLDARSLRAVAHPVRLRILGVLRLEGPATATGLAAQLGLNSGATSYHLRQLAAGGLIVEDTARGTARERWWRAAHRSSSFKFAALDEDDNEIGVAYLRALALTYAERMQRAAEERPLLPREWRDTAAFSDIPFRLTAAEAGALLHDLREVLARYRTMDKAGDEGAPPGAQPFHVQLQAFLRPGLDLSPDSDDDA